ncbi:thiol-disulfide isomerase/thioredoxin [Mucilaginibacter oryzae]|uniref:Thiol-disulfide isomerase/thioredoxin n=1 Tax=Mucilaginibacter oryzae TaxID=468058 RepID=A0A316HG72_9SPHI|nr:TlpA disulfide reductase family protein [Mucilaginibacter oryzae]PWK80224.1 thiol-disulfide isomerase/thioredoxin [Mucilaginibacter oryzae]
MKKLNLIFFLLQFLCFSNSYAQSVLIEKGKEFEINSHTIINSADNQNDYNYTFRFKVSGREGANTLLDCMLVKAVTFEGFTKYSFANSNLNTDSIRKCRFNSTGALLPLAMLQQPLKLTIGPRGELVTITGFDEALQTAITRWELKDDIAGQLINNGKAFPKEAIESLFLPLPPQRIAYKSEWVNTGRNYKVIAINGALLYVTLSNSSAPDNKTKDGIKGSAVFNDVTGLAEEFEIEDATKIAGNNKKLMVPVFKRKQTVRYGTEKHSPDTAWFNMAIKMNTGFSKAFKINMEVDSVKSKAYFKSHDAAFAADPYYAVAKLGLLQGSGRYIEYTNQLLKTPTRFLKDNDTHLYNKFNSLIEISADSAYEVARYMYKSPDFNELIQHSYAQSFLSYDIEDMMKEDDFKNYVKEKNIGLEDMKKMVAEKNEKQRDSKSKARQLLEFLHNDHDQLMHQKINALYLWVDAKNSVNDLDALGKAATAFMRMDDAYMKQGNGGRYALLTYKMLISAQKQKAADALLSKIIGNLERYTADTLNANRFADQNLLAYAYYLHYKAAKVTDSVKALRYLAKAARYSPRNNKEKAYASFYDRVFLHSKEGYRDEFMECLFNSGDEQQALQVFAEQINAEPVNLSEMQKIYQQHVPGKSFPDFFKADVLTAWQPAPAFTLKGIDGKSHSLADFKNKWLVIDFWGTWCGPCRAEMPDINTFNQEINDGKHQGIAFMSIACRDSETNVKSYFAANNFNLSALMSDGNIEKQYAISGYPSKIIISPDGKMLPLKFGDDWISVIKKFNELAPASKL